MSPCEAAPLSAGTDIIQWGSDNGSEQQWPINGNQIVNENSSMCVTTDGVAGDPLTQEPCSSSPDQTWLPSYVWWAGGSTLPSLLAWESYRREACRSVGTAPGKCGLGPGARFVFNVGDESQPTVRHVSVPNLIGPDLVPVQRDTGVVPHRASFLIDFERPAIGEVPAGYGR
jgi:hypothetical protein